jgi:hypothetical protein
MESDMTWTLLAAALAAPLLTGCAPVAETTDWDADADQIGYDEWAPSFAEADVYGAWDLDDDDLLSEDEWKAGFGERFGVYEVNRWGMYRDWDSDRSGDLSEIEFSSGVFEHYDLDGDAVLLGDEAGAFEADWR